VVGGSNPLVPTNCFIVALILLTNDDGIDSEGLRILEECVKDLADIVVVAPDRERSAISHSITVHSPLEIRQLNKNHYNLNGTPADCVIFGLSDILSSPPDLVISGINRGANLGDDIMYSGTVAGAREASRRGIAALAISQAYDDSPVRYTVGAKFIKLLVKDMLEKKSGGGIYLNINIPVHKIRGVRITRQGCSLHFPHFNFLDEDAGVGRDAVEITKDRQKSEIPLDYQAIMEHYISVTPLQRDQTDYAMAHLLHKDPPRIFRRLRVPGIGLIG
jgi:5'-nucleotidase